MNEGSGAKDGNRRGVGRRAGERSVLRWGRMRVSIPWAVAAAVMVVFIWSNSTVPGDDSSSASLGVVAAVQGALQALGLPSGWVTNLLVRKTGHLLEYAALGALVSQASDPDRSPARSWLPLAIVVLAAVPAIDEAIQLFVPGREGRLADVVLDWTGATLGVLVRMLIVRTGRRGEEPSSP